MKDYKITNLQDEYIFLSSILLNMEKHLNKLYLKGFIPVYERNIYLKSVNDIVRNMNTLYNKNMSETFDSDSDNGNLSEIFINSNEIKESSIEDISEISKITKILTNDTENISMLNEIKNKIVNLSYKIGFFTISDCLKILVSPMYKSVYDEKILNELKIYNKIFIPVKYSERKIKSKKNIILTTLDPLNETLLTSCLEIKIKKINEENTYLCLSGFLTYDGLNLVLKTSQICNNFIFKKKKSIEEYLEKVENISFKFRKNYLKNAPLRDILCLTEEDFTNKMMSDYETYKKISKLTFLNLVQEFVKDCTKISSIQNMFTILKLLLMGSEDNINIAGLLFGLTKDKKQAHNNVSNILFNNLNYLMQIKLKKTGSNIKAELERINNLNVDEVDFKKQLALCKNMPSDVKKCALEKLEEMKASNNEYYKQLLYVKCLLNFPWPGKDDDLYFEDIGKNNKKSVEFLDTIVNKLDEKVFGHTQTKDTIKELMGKWIKNPNSSGSAIGLVGPPGVGKTLIAKAIGDALDIPFVQITLGGQNDGDVLFGHGYSYSGAQPGMVIKQMIKAGSSRCIMFFDELDKASSKNNNNNEIFNILIHMTDPNTNKEFQDRFFQEINFPLNKVIFVFSYNNSELVDPILLDRITEIETKPYSIKDKINITKNFLINEVSATVGFNKNSIKMSDDDIKFLIEEYTNEAGVRELKRKLEKIFLKMNIDIIYDRESINKKSISIDKDIIIKYLNKVNSRVKKVHSKDLVGVINGLYATESGSGGITPIQIYNNYTGSDKKFILKLTGRQGDIMKESVMTSLTAAMHCLKEDIRINFMKNNPYGMHIHTPCGSIPKDGPSAGCAFTTAFVSRILGLKIKRTVAMTGEIEPTGFVTKIGGLICKLNGAKKAGVKLVLVSKENADDIKEIKKNNPELITKTFRVKTVTHVTEIFKEALIDFDESVLEKY